MQVLTSLFGRAAGVRGGRFDLSPVTDRLKLWWHCYLSRRALGELDGRLLRDVGLTPEQQHRETARYFFEI